MPGGWQRYVIRVGPLVLNKLIQLIVTKKWQSFTNSILVRWYHLDQYFIEKDNFCSKDHDYPIPLSYYESSDDIKVKFLHI